MSDTSRSPRSAQEHVPGQQTRGNAAWCRGPIGTTEDVASSLRPRFNERLGGRATTAWSPAWRSGSEHPKVEHRSSRNSFFAEHAIQRIARGMYGTHDEDVQRRRQRSISDSRSCVARSRASGPLGAHSSLLRLMTALQDYQEMKSSNVQRQSGPDPCRAVVCTVLSGPPSSCCKTCRTCAAKALNSRTHPPPSLLLKIALKLDSNSLVSTTYLFQATALRAPRWAREASPGRVWPYYKAPPHSGSGPSLQAARCPLRWNGAIQ